MRRTIQNGRCVAICSGCERNTKVFDNMTYEEAKNLNWFCQGCSITRTRGEKTPVESRLASMGLLPAQSAIPAYTKLENNFVGYKLDSNKSDLDFNLEYVKLKTPSLVGV